MLEMPGTTVVIEMRGMVGMLGRHNAWMFGINGMRGGPRMSGMPGMRAMPGY